MKQALQIVFLFVATSLFSQTTIPEIAASETVTFVAATSGCFNAATNTYKFVKQKNGDRKISCTINKVSSTKRINAKNYEAFVKRYEESARRFSDPDETPLCTTISTFELSSKKGNSKFKNGNCLPDFDPENLLTQLLK